ncbi:MAG: DNA polymerase III subunit delta' [Desulfobulbaceae bacterium]|nr:MAG: DNA polymerase III subunit delta' [Desulfobulbaceae bacterium]
MAVAFSALIEQDQAKEMLRRAIGSGKLAHAYLFRGPAGIGKKTAAQALAATLNCRSHQLFTTPDRKPAASTKPILPRPDLLEACGACPSCRKFASGNHPDFMEILPEGAAIKIEQIREIKKALVFPPLEAGNRVVLLAEVHTMRREAANSLLKVLEEPPPSTIFILTGDEAGGILPTIVSRCQVIPFFPLSVTHLANILVLQEKIDQAEATTLAAVAEGSLSRARILRQKNLLNLRREVLIMLLTYTQEAPAATVEVLRLAEKCAKLEKYLDDFLDLLSSFFHDLTVYSAAHDHQKAADHRFPPRPLINQDLAPLLAHAKDRWNLRDDPDTFSQHREEQLRRAKSQLKRNCNRTLICEVLFFDLF